MSDPNHMEWIPGAMENARMLPMANSSWEGILALPDDSEAMLIWVLPFGSALRMHLIDITPTTREQIGKAMVDGVIKPSTVIYVLPETVVPEPEDFINDRKDADTND